MIDVFLAFLIPLDADVGVDLKLVYDGFHPHVF
jgi:hypothetical protein